jgi:hypothetical protein
MTLWRHSNAIRKDSFNGAVAGRSSLFPYQPEWKVTRAAPAPTKPGVGASLMSDIDLGISAA